MLTAELSGIWQELKDGYREKFRGGCEDLGRFK
jgi:hypothetical protein